MSKIDEILDNYYNGRTLDIFKTEVWFRKVGEPQKPADWYTEAKAELLQLVLEVIGEDETDNLFAEDNPLYFARFNYINIDNMVKEEQRKRAKELFGGDNGTQSRP